MALGDIIVFKKGGDVGIIVDNDVFTLASENDVPDDIPEDFWPTVARYKLLGDEA